MPLNTGYDGQKYICVDDFVGPQAVKPCVMYSFGVSNDISFEQLISKYGRYHKHIEDKLNKTTLYFMKAVKSIAMITQ